jgi:hypothetical protein
VSSKYKYKDAGTFQELALHENRPSVMKAAMKAFPVVPFWNWSGGLANYFCCLRACSSYTEFRHSIPHYPTLAGLLAPPFLVLAGCAREKLALV